MTAARWMALRELVATIVAYARAIRDVLYEGRDILLGVATDEDDA